MIRLSGLYSYEALPLISAVQELSTVQFEWMNFHTLCDSFIQGKVDGILCHPLTVVQFPKSLIIPGVGIATSGGIPSPVLYSNKPIESIRTIYVDKEYIYWENWLKIIWNLLNSDNKENTVQICKEKTGEADAYLTGLEDLEDKQEGVHIYNLGEIWKRVSNYPMVCWVWLCRGDSDYKRIRHFLGHIWNSAKEKLEAFKRGSFTCTELHDRSVVKNISYVYYNLASNEFAGIHWLIEQGKHCGVVSPEADIHIC